jgi:hypothetical protein
MVSAITTNADHEPARQLLLRIFIFIGAVLMYPTDPELGRGDAGHPASTAPFTMPETARLHLPDLTQSEGVIDFLALRSFIALYPALITSAYAHSIKASALPINDQLWQDVEIAWRFAVELDQYIDEHYLVVETPQASLSNPKPATFADAAEHALLLMAASLIRYRSSVPTKHPKVDVPFGFTPRRFKAQVRQMLARFDLRRKWSLYVNAPDNALPEAPLFQADQKLSEAQIANVPIVKALDDMLDSDKSWEYLLPWDANSIPFALQVVTKDA